MDEKYEGCNIVESVVTTARQPEAGNKKRADSRARSHFLMRLIISAIIIGVILIVHYCPSLPLASGLKGVLKKVFCYDVFGRGTFGVTLFG